MSVLTKIKSEQLKARKAKETSKSSLLTTLLGEIETLQKNKNKELSDNDIFAVIEKFVKNNTQTIAQIGESHAMYDSIVLENRILEDFLPKKLTESELKTVIQSVIDDNENVNMGTIMGFLKNNYANLYDGKTASQLTKTMIV
jgi:hypothetical protein